MNALELLSALNWCMAILYVFVAVLAVGVFPLPPTSAATLCGVSLLLAVPFGWLGAVVEKGRGRGFQTAVSIVSLFNFPIGTVFGAYALWVCWASDHRARFEAGAASDLPPSRAGAGDADDEVTVPQARPEESPYAYAQRLKRSGLSASAIRQRLTQRGLDREEIETLLGATAAGARSRR
jgi:hypothetical protein